jgi:hypothetical protein
MGTYRILVGKGEGNKPLGKLGYRWKEILKQIIKRRDKA